MSEASSPASLPRAAIRWSILTLLLFFAVEAMVFRSGWYLEYLFPDSSTGSVEYPLYWLRHTRPDGHREAMVVGDSRIAEGFSVPDAAAAADHQLTFWNEGFPGTTPRDWYYFLRDADPSRRRFAAIAVELDSYSDQDAYDSAPDRIGDLNFSIGRLRITDCLDFAASMKSNERRRTALAGCLFKGLVLRSDVQDFLLDRQQRLRDVHYEWDRGLETANGYPGNPADLRGLSVDFEKRTIQFPPGLTQAQTETTRAMLLPNWAPDTGELTSYRTLWLGRILDLYRDSSTKIVFFETPRAPLPVPDAPTPPRFLQSVRSDRRVVILAETTFRDLERPELFADGLHLNRTGRVPFSQRLAEKLAAISQVH